MCSDIFYADPSTLGHWKKTQDGFRKTEALKETLGDRRDADIYIHGVLTYSPFVRSVDETAYELKLNEVKSLRREKVSNMTVQSLLT